MNKSTIKIIFGLTILALLVTSQVKADDQDFLWEENNNQITFSYHDLHFIAKAGGQVPKFQFITTAHEFEYSIMFKSLIEYMDYNGDGVFQYNETGIWKEQAPGEPVFSNILSLSSVRWTFSGFDVEYIDITEEQKEVSAVHFSYISESVKAPNYSEFEIEIPRSRASYSKLFHWFLERFPLLGGLLGMIRMI